MVQRSWTDTFVSLEACSGTLFLDQSENRTGNRAIQNTNFSVYTLTIEINLLDFNPKYPKNPKTLGEKIRKARMDKGLEIKELAGIVGVTEDSVINWEIRGIMPRKRYLGALKRFLEV